MKGTAPDMTVASKPTRNPPNATVQATPRSRAPDSGVSAPLGTFRPAARVCCAQHRPENDSSGPPPPATTAPPGSCAPLRCNRFQNMLWRTRPPKSSGARPRMLRQGTCIETGCILRPATGFRNRSQRGGSQRSRTNKFRGSSEREGGYLEEVQACACVTEAAVGSWRNCG